MSEKGFYTPRGATIRLLMLAALLAGTGWAGWVWYPGPEPMDAGSAFGKAIARGVFFVLLLFIPFMLKDLFEALRYARTMRKEMERAYRPSGRYDTGAPPVEIKGRGDAPDNWQ